MKIYHNPRCSKSRKTLELIRQAGLTPEVILYLDAPPSIEQLDTILGQLGMEPGDLMRRGESVFSELGLADREMNRNEAIAVMVEHPKLIERPIVCYGGSAVLGRPPESIQPLLERAVAQEGRN